MWRTIFFVVSITMSAISIPKIYSENPELFQTLVGLAIGSSETAEKSNSSDRRIVKNNQPRSSNPLAGRRVRLDMDERGHFVSDFKLNGRRITALVDTGATLVAINASTARRIGINLVASDYKFPVNTANGQVLAAAAYIDEIQIGRINIARVQTAILPDKALGNTLLGMSFLKRLGRFEVENRTLILEQ